MKRLIDAAVALSALAVLALPLGFIAVAVWLEDGASPLYCGVRIGRGGRLFRMLKFRSMRRDAWKSGVNSTAAGDRRITAVGRRLRRWKLDELPQLVNVLLGDMSLVGPRPQVPEDAGLYTAEERKLFAVRPGITDMASIVFADESEILAGSPDPDLLYNQIIRPWKSRLALTYLDRRGFAVDLRIVVLTLLSAVSRRRALDCVARMLEELGADPLLVGTALRQAPLTAFPPPGATEIVGRYPRKAANA